MVSQSWIQHPLRTLADVERFEREMPLDERLGARSVHDVFVQAAARDPEHPAITMLLVGDDDEQPRRVSYGALLGLIRQAANLFHRLGGARPTVAYMLPSLIETHATLWGAETAGCAVPINFLLQPDAIAALLRAADVRILVALGPHPQLELWQKALALRKQLPDLQLLRVAPPGAPPPAEAGVVDFHPALLAEPADRLVFGEPGSGDAVAAYFHTGGTTGAPKLVAHTHAGQLAAALGGAALNHMSSDDVATATLPLFHVGGTIALGLSCFLVGAEILVMSPAGLRNPKMVAGFWRLCARHGVTLAGGVPTSIAAIVEVPLGDADLRRVRTGLTGAAALPLAVGERFRQVTGKALHEIYGMTEASGLIAIDPALGEGGAGSVGFRLPYTEVTVRRRRADGSLGEACAVDEVGVLTVRGPTVAPGYKNPAHDPGVFSAGELNTGDLAYTDKDGRIHIAGRAKDLIVRGGHNIDPQMIENAMQHHPAVALAAVVGMPDAYAGELPVCYVTLRPGATASEAELHAYAQQTIAERPAWPKHIYQVDTIPVTTVGKIYKPTLRCDATARLVKEIVHGQHGLPAAQVDVREGGPRGMTVIVRLPAEHASAVASIKQALSAYVFEADVAMLEA